MRWIEPNDKYMQLLNYILLRNNEWLIKSQSLYIKRFYNGLTKSERRFLL